MELAVGTIISGKVTAITKFGAFVSLPGGKSGLVHISEVAAAFVSDVHDYLTEGQEVTVKILSVSPEGKINLSITQVGCTVDQLKLTETRMSNQQETLQELQSENDNLDLSEIIINYTAMYNAYQSSLTAAGKLSGMTLLNYL